MSQLFANNAASRLVAGISNVSLSLQIAAGDGVLFPNPTGGDYFLVTLSKITSGIETSREIVKVTARATDVFTIVRAQEGTTALSYLEGDYVQLRLTAASSTDLEVHKNSVANPHAVTKAQVGLGNVDNTSDATKNSATATLTNKTLTAPVINAPTGIVKADIGLSNVDNTSDATKNAATATLTNKTLTAPVINSPTGIVKGNVGLGNVDNTSDANKPVSTAQATAIALKADNASKDASGGYPGLTLFKLNLRNVANTVTSWITNTATVARTWTMPDKDGTVAMTSDITGTNSGTNTGDQTITLTGDVTGSGTGSFAATIAAGAVTLAKQANMATASVFYRKTAGSGAPEVQTLATLKTDLGLTGTNSGDQTLGSLGAEGTANKDATGGYAGLTLFKINFKNALNTFTSFFTNANTAARTYTFQDRDGTIADNTDLALKAPLASPTFTGTVTTAVLNASGTISGASGVLGSQGAPTAISAANIANNSVVGIRTGTPDVSITGGEGSGLKLQTLSGRGGIFLGALSPTNNKDASSLVVYTGSDSGATYTEKMRLNSNGNLLIGTPTDDGTNKLQVSGGTALTGALTVSGYVTSTAGFVIPNTGYYLGRDSGGNLRSVLTVTSDTNSITRFTSAIDAGGFQWTNQSQSTNWMSLNGSGLSVNGTLTSTGQTSLGGSVGAEGLRVINVASAVNRVQITGQTTGGAPVVSAQGSDTNVRLHLTGQGASGVIIGSNLASNRIAEFEHKASSVNYFRIVPSATLGTPTISVGGTDTNITTTISGKGSGGVSLCSNDGSNLIAAFAHNGSTVNYHTIYGGATGLPVTLEARGSDTNVGINLLPKGTGVVSVTGALLVTGASTFSGTAIHSDQQLTQAMLKDCAVVAVDKGNSSTTTQTFDYTAGSKQKVTATGNHTFAFSNWPPTGNEGYIRVDFINYGAYTITPPTVTWTNPDGSETTSLSTHFTALAAAGGRSGFTASGITKAIFWSSDAGTTVYGKFI